MCIMQARSEPPKTNKTGKEMARLRVLYTSTTYMKKGFYPKNFISLIDTSIENNINAFRHNINKPPPTLFSLDLTGLKTHTPLRPSSISRLSPIISAHNAHVQPFSTSRSAVSAWADLPDDVIRYLLTAWRGFSAPHERTKRVYIHIHIKLEARKSLRRRRRFTASDRESFLRLACIVRHWEKTPTLYGMVFIVRRRSEL